jgi:hypothetical protein
MARQKALGHWLREGKVRQQRMSGTPQLKEKVVVENWWWKIRGALWGACSAGSIILISLSELPPCYRGHRTEFQTALFSLHPLPSISFLASILPVFVVTSLLWTAWDPTYMTIQKGALQGRDVRVHGKHNYTVGLLKSVDYLVLTQPRPFNCRLGYPVSSSLSYSHLVTEAHFSPATSLRIHEYTSHYASSLNWQ